MENVWGTRGEVGGSPLADPLNSGRIFSCLVTKSCLILCNPVDCSPPVSSCPWNFPARTLEWVAISVSKGSSHPGLKSTSPALAGGFFTTSYVVRKRAEHVARVAKKLSDHHPSGVSFSSFCSLKRSGKIM